MAKSAKPTTAGETTAADAKAGREYTVLARRYRPRQFGDCVGQDHVCQALTNAIATDRVAHAYLFTGSRGVGKTTMARIFAKALNCVKGPTATPCDACDICLAVATGDDVDVIEIDGASNRGIDEVRELRQAVHYRPARGRYKIYIIDEVHMLTKEAFNALLKTLEEPPGHAKFLFATTEAQKIPITILSRCQRFDFAGIEQSKIQARLREIVDAEGMSVDDEALEIIARRAGGSMRDSQSLLDQLLAFGGERLTAEDVHRVMGTAGDERVAELVRQILAGDAAACLASVGEATHAGLQLGEWVEQTLGYFRDLMVLAVHPEAELVSVPNRMRPTLLEQARSRSPERLLEMMDLMAACRARMRQSTYGRTLLEMTLVRLCRLDQFLAVTQLSSVAGTASAPAPAPAVLAPSAAPAAPAGSKKNAETAVTAPPSGSPPTEASAGAGQPLSSDNAPPVPAALTSFPLDPESVGQFWKVASGQVGDPILTNMLSEAVEVRLTPPATIDVGFAADKAYFKGHCEEAARIGKIEAECARLGGKAVKVRFHLVGADTAERTPKAASAQQLREQAARDPIVRHAEQVLGARMLKVDLVANSAPTPPSQDDVSSELEKQPS